MPLAAVAVMVALPTAAAVTLPSASTVAIASSDDLHVTDLSVVVSGRMVATRSTVSVALSDASVLFKLIAPAGVATTVTLSVAFTSVLDFAVIVIIVEPSDRAVTFPPSSTEATAGSELSKTIDLSVVVSGVTTALIALTSPTRISRLSPVIPSASLSMVMPPAGVSATVITQLAEMPLAAVAVIVALPTATAVTLPSASTVAIASSDEVHVTDLSVVVSGRMVATRSTVSVALSDASVLFKLITPAGVATTVTLSVAFTSVLDLAVIVIIVEPSDRAVTFPSSSTLAIAGSELSNTTDLSVVVSGVTTTLIALTSPTRISRLSPVIPSAPLSMVIPPAGVSVTVITQVAEMPLAAVAVMVALPTATAVTLPSASTVAIASSDEVHVTDLSVAFSGNMVAISSIDSLTLREASVLLRDIFEASTPMGLMYLNSFHTLAVLYNSTLSCGT